MVWRSAKRTMILPEIKEVMSAFYVTVKGLDKHLKFVFITGVSKFAKISVFSGMNSLSDISMDVEYATLCGITQQELGKSFYDSVVGFYSRWWRMTICEI